MTNTSKTFNKAFYNFTFIQSINILKFFANLNNIRSIITRTKIIDVIAFAQLNVKFYYDRKYYLKILVVENWILFRFHKNYNIFFIVVLRKKINQQYVEFFRVMKKIDRLVYRINVSLNWRIYSIVFIMQLKFCFAFSKNLFRKFCSINSNFVFVENNTIEIKFYELKRLINKRMIKRDVEYFVKWKKYDSKHDVWKKNSKLDNIMNFVREYKNSIRYIIFLSNRQKLFIFKTLRNILITTSKKFISSTKWKFVAKSFFVIKRRFLIVVSSRILSIFVTIVKNSFVNFSSIVTLIVVDIILDLTFISKALILRRFAKSTRNETSNEK